MQTFKENSSITCLLEISSDLILSGSEFGQLTLWNVTNNTKVFSVKGHTNQISGLKLVDSYTFVSASWDTNIRVWNLTNGHQIRNIPNNATIFSLTLLNKILLASGDNKYKIQIWNVINGSHLNTLNGHSQEIYTLELMSNSVLASGSYDSEIILWNLLNSQIIRKMSVSSSVWSFKRLSDLTFAAGCENGNIFIGNINGTLNKTLIGHTSFVFSLNLYNETMLISGSSDFTLKIWSISNWNLITSFENNASINIAIEFSNTHKTLDTTTFNALPSTHFETTRFDEVTSVTSRTNISESPTTNATSTSTSSHLETNFISNYFFSYLTEASTIDNILLTHANLTVSTISLDFNQNDTDTSTHYFHGLANSSYSRFSA